ncbi:hypothetical protein QBC32DRAFT_207938 [Pseudoneurospora amorphoporcata]|uniref:Uncharacterized protein n=1 Tax=Pseudoneurospora amorphoporcata TaxID=241081 RepID=A0AAN6NYG4_9PEZI|nr:hypothetical protein QBC32DRAFT_207938 [Pseudoneurospora amorphoporcata]
MNNACLKGNRFTGLGQTGLRIHGPQPTPPSTSGIQTRSKSRLQNQEDAGFQDNARLTHPNVPAASAFPFGEWRPDIAYGSELWVQGEDLSRIEIADRRVARARLRVEHYRHAPSPAIFQQQLDEEIRKREELDENDEENTKPISTLASTHIEASNKRLELLREVLVKTESEAQRVNIEAAIAGYESGAIPFSRSYTLIWAGRIVDTCPDYGSFTTDRDDRLDRYVDEHGHGWLWHEPPLATQGKLRAKKGTSLENPLTGRLDTYGQGHYHIKMYFRARKEKVMREGPKRAKKAEAKAEAKAPEFSNAQPDEVAQVVELSLLLDSGATLPCIKLQDLALLDIDPKTYPAQTALELKLGEGTVKRPIYELDVGFRFGEEDRAFHTVPVIVLEGDSRLSGMLPFNVCYMSSAPGTYRMWLGQKRRDILGAGRLPGRMKAGGVHDGESRNPFYGAPGTPAYRFWATGGIDLRDRDTSARFVKDRTDEHDARLEEPPKSFRFEHDLGYGETWVDIGSSSGEEDEEAVQARTVRKVKGTTGSKSQAPLNRPTDADFQASIERVRRLKREIQGATGQPVPEAATGKRKK